ncbi:MAG TPA: phosphoribosylglycinamide formyltransferase [Spirochaetia bacterium]|nr:phosphoribosylglycinamide formyltransferase [Spirochaetia bacterium]
MDTRIAVFASGRGSNLEAIIERIEREDLRNARIVLVISNNSRAGALDLARNRGIEAVHISTKTHPVETDYENSLHELLRRHRVDLVLLAGYMKLLPPSLIRAYPKRILNIHPALLPKFGGKGMYGIKVHTAVLKAGEKETGVTIHFVNERYDEGAVIDQAHVPVLDGDTPESLASRVLEVEHGLYWKVIDAVINGRRGREDE